MCRNITPGGVWRPCEARKEEAIYTSSSWSLQETCYWRTATEQVSIWMLHNPQGWIPQLHTPVIGLKGFTCEWVSRSLGPSDWPQRRWVWLSLNYIPGGGGRDRCGNYCCWGLSRIREGESDSIPPKSEEDPTCPPRPIVHDFHHPAQCHCLHGDLLGLPATSEFSNLWTSWTPLTDFIAAHGLGNLNTCPISSIKQFLNDRDFVISSFLGSDNKEDAH